VGSSASTMDGEFPSARKTPRVAVAAGELNRLMVHSLGQVNRGKRSLDWRDVIPRGRAVCRAEELDVMQPQVARRGGAS